MALKDLLLAEYDHEVASARRLLERLPDDRLSWRPHARSMTLGGLGTHLAHVPTWTHTVLGQPGFDMADMPADRLELASREDIMTLFDESTAKARLALDQTDAQYLAPWTLKRDAREVFTVPSVMAFRSFVLNHLIHHRGQLSVYLRLLDVPVPAIYGPSADEG
jgi:uncharacterized damage-inducible protein DinB